MDADKKSHDGIEQVETSGGDFIGRDKIVRGDEVYGDKVLGDKVVYTRSQMEELDDYLTRAVAAYEADRLSAVLLLPTSFDKPYKFLDAFKLEDAHIFFGRDGAKEDLYRILLKDRLTILHAKSGVGKTSLLNAGLSPRLISEGRLPVYARAYEEPVLAIKQAIAPISLGPWPELLPKLTLHEFLGVACAKLSRRMRELVIVLDQFEEFFVFWPEREHRQPFIDALAECYEDAALPIRLIIALRKGYYSDLADLEGRIPAVFHNQYRLDTMTRDEAQAAITGPVAKLGRPVDYEQDLLDTLLDDLARGGMELPHLQIMCTELCKALAAGEMQITLASYEELGRAEGILTDYLNGMLERLPTGRQALAKEILKELVSSEATKRVLSYGALVGRIEAEEDELDRTLAWLMGSRLLHREEIEGEIRYEMAHEYLIEEIGEWIDRTDLAFKQAQELLMREVANWRVYGTLIPRDRLEVLRAQHERLGGLDDESWECLLRSALQADFAVEEWARLAGEVGEKLLLSTLGDPHEELGRAATRGLGAIWGLSEVSQLANEDSHVRQRAAEALGKLGDARAVEPLIAALWDKDRDVFREAARALRELGDVRATEPLIAALRDEDRDVCREAAWALGELGDARAVEPLIAALRDEDSGVRLMATSALGAIWRLPEVSRLGNGDSNVRQRAAEALGELGDVRAVEPLIAALWDENDDVHQRAAEALRKLGEPAIYTRIDKSWIDAQLERESHRAFAKDVALAIKVAGAEEPPNLVQVVRGCLIYATLGTLATNVPPVVLGAMAYVGQAPKARGYAALMQDTEKQGEAYRLIGEALLEREEIKAARQVLKQALAAAEASGKPKTSALKEVAVSLTRAGELKQALETVERIRESADGANALISMAGALAKTRDIEGLIKVLEATEAIEIESHRAITLSWVAAAFAEVGLRARATEIMDVALAAAEGISYTASKVEVLMKVAWAMVDAGQRNRAVEVAKRGLAEAIGRETTGEGARELVWAAQALGKVRDRDGLTKVLEATEAIELESQKAAALSWVAAAFAEIGEIERALAVADEIKNSVNQTYTLMAVARILVKAGQIDRAKEIASQALSTAEAIEDTYNKANALLAMVAVLASVGEIEQAVKVAETFRDTTAEAFALSRLAQPLIEAGQEDRAVVMVERALTLVEKRVGDEATKASALIEVAQALAEVGELERALAVTGAIRDEESREQTLGSVVAKLLTHMEVKDAVDRILVTETIEDEWPKAGALLFVVQYLVEMGQDDEAMETAELALATAAAVGNAYHKARLLQWLAQFLVKAGRKGRAAEVAGLALTTSEAIEDAFLRARVLIWVGQILLTVGQKDRAAQVAEQALAAARVIKEARPKSHILKQVAVVLGAAGAIEQALVAVESIEDHGMRGGVLHAMAEAMAQAGDKDGLHRVLAAAEVLENEGGKADALGGVAQALVQIGDKDGLNRTLAVAEALEDEGSRADALSWAAQAMAQAGDKDGLNRALAAFEEIGNECKKRKVESVSRVVQALTKGGEVDELNRALAIAEGINVEWRKENALKEIMAALTEFGQIEQALAVAETIKTVDLKVDVLTGAALALAKKGETGGLKQALTSAVALVKLDEIDPSAVIGTPSPRNLAELARVLVEVGWKDYANEVAKRAMASALAQASRYPNRAQKTCELIAVAKDLVEVGLEGRQADITSRVLTLADKSITEYKSSLTAGLSGLAQVAAALGLKDKAVEAAKQAMTEALVAAKMMDRASGLIGLAKALTELRSEEGLSRVLAAAKGIENQKDKANALILVAYALVEMGDEVETRKAIRDAFDAARLAGRDCTFDVLKQGVTTLAALDQGETLWQVCEAVMEVESWWGR